MRPLKAAWIAGVCDSGVVTAGVGNHRGVYKAYLQITRGPKDLVDILARKVSGSLVFFRRQYGPYKYKNRNVTTSRAGFSWVLTSSSELISFIDAIMPFLEVRRKQFSLLRQLAALYATHKRGGNDSKWSVRDLKRAGQLVVQIKTAKPIRLMKRAKRII